MSEYNVNSGTQPEAVDAGWKGAAAETATGFKKKEVSLAARIHSRARAAAENQLATKRILNIRAAKLLNKQPCQRHHASAFLLRRLQAEDAVFQFPDSALLGSNARDSLTRYFFAPACQLVTTVMDSPSAAFSPPPVTFTRKRWPSRKGV